ncbi:unnamed protein product [Caenorhabditis sp. 36 PRJEB53466]|nr:unnamed protein product [Caenorhabditis sp. 36 PRJEB53466]
MKMLNEKMENLISSDSEPEEEELPGERERAIEARNAAARALRQKREADRQAEEERRFPKQTRLEPLTLGEQLKQKIMAVALDGRNEFINFIPRLEKHFDGYGKGVLNKRMKGFRKWAQLVRFINEKHQSIVSDETKTEDQDLHNFLVKYQKEIAEVLAAMTSIPKEEAATAIAIGDVFVEARNTALQNLAVKNMSLEFTELARKKRLQEELENQIIVANTRMELREFGQEVENELLEELSNIGINEVRAVRDTSPSRGALSEKAKEQLTELLKNMLVTRDVRTGKKFAPPQTVRVDEQQDEESDDGEDLASMAMKQLETAPLKKVVEEPNERPTVAPRELFANLAIFREPETEEIEEEPAGSGSEDDSEEEDSESEIVHDNAEEWRNFFGIERRGNRYDGPEAPDTLVDWWVQNRYTESWKKNKKVGFVAFTDPRNTMRLYVQPNGNFYKCDNSPMTTHTTVSLEKGWKELLKQGDPFPTGTKHDRLACFQLEMTETAQKLTIANLHSCFGLHEQNLLGRFFFHREAIEKQMDRFDPRFTFISENRLFDIYTQRELFGMCCDMREGLSEPMRPGYLRPVKKLYPPFQKKKEVIDEHEEDPGEEPRKAIDVHHNQVKSVLVLTDWRLAHFNTSCLTNAVVQFMPTNLGTAFFQTMELYLTNILQDANLEIKTIIFAFGGCARFRIDDFSEFMKKLAIQALQRVTVLWFAQDWLDGITYKPQERAYLIKFNEATRRLFLGLRLSGNRNYHWLDIRAKYGIEYSEWCDLAEQENGYYEGKLEQIYFSYLDCFIKKGNCFANSCFFIVERRDYNKYAEDQSVRPHKDSKFRVKYQEQGNMDDFRDHQIQNVRANQAYARPE